MVSRESGGKGGDPDPSGPEYITAAHLAPERIEPILPPSATSRRYVWCAFSTLCLCVCSSSFRSANPPLCACPKDPLPRFLRQLGRFHEQGEVFADDQFVFRDLLVAYNVAAIFFLTLFSVRSLGTGEGSRSGGAE